MLAVAAAARVVVIASAIVRTSSCSSRRRAACLLSAPCAGRPFGWGICFNASGGAASDERPGRLRSRV